MILVWSPFKIVSVSVVLYPRWPPLLKIEISSNGQNGSILSQKVPKFELYKHNEQWKLTFISSFWNITRKVLKLKKKLIEGPNRRTHFWKRTNQWLFHQNFVLIEQMVSDKKIFVWRVIPLEMHFFVDSLLLVTQIIKGKQLYYKMWSRKS
jgi:hypothetical protein